MSVVFLFPSQSSKRPGMLDEVLGLYPEGAALVDEASERLGRDLRRSCETLESNRDVQLGVFLVNELTRRLLESAGLGARLSLGASLGEYNHLVHIGALDFFDALELVDLRGEAYDAGPEGARAVVFPVERETLEPHLAAGSLEIAGELAPGMTLLGGEPRALDAALDALEREIEALFVRRLSVRLPIHCSLFRGVADRFSGHLARRVFRVPVLPYVPNVTGEILDAPGRAELVELLRRQVCEPILWSRSLEAVVAREPRAVFVEAGAGSSLRNAIAAVPGWLGQARTLGVAEALADLA